jgi:hypothetical protein
MQVADASRVPTGYNYYIPAFSPLVSSTPALPNISAGVNIAFHAQEIPLPSPRIDFASCFVRFSLSLFPMVPGSLILSQPHSFPLTQRLRFPPSILQLLSCSSNYPKTLYFVCQYQPT